MRALCWWYQYFELQSGVFTKNVKEVFASLLFAFNLIGLITDNATSYRS